MVFYRLEKGFFGRVWVYRFSGFFGFRGDFLSLGIYIKFSLGNGKAGCIRLSGFRYGYWYVRKYRVSRCIKF